MSSSNGTSATARTPLRRNGAGSARAGASAPFGASTTATAKNSPMKMPPSSVAAAALTEPPLPPDHYPATVYRYTKTRGWERYRSSTPQFAAARSRRRLLAGGAASSSQAAAAAGGKGSTGSSAMTDRQQMQQQPVCAVPRRGCVEVRALRLRIRLFAEDDPSGAENTTGTNNNNQGGTVSGTTTSSSSKENTLVIRRSSRVLLSSRRNLGAVVLKFRSVPMAMQFCSRLMELNATAYASDGALAGGGSGNGINDLGRIGTIGGSWMSNPMSLGGPPSSLSAMGMPMMQPSAGLGSHSSGGTCSSIGTPSITSYGEQQQLQPEADMASYMVRLLHDPSFLSFVNSMESALTTSVAGGELMLKALAMSGAAATASSASS